MSTNYTIREYEYIINDEAKKAIRFLVSYRRINDDTNQVNKMSGFLLSIEDNTLLYPEKVSLKIFKSLMFLCFHIIFVMARFKIWLLSSLI